MALTRPQPTGIERFFDKDEIIVSKTDLTGKITYANRVFVRVSGYTEAELLGAPHSILRHPDMPRCVFKLLWDTIQSGREIFAYVVNLSKNGDHYWVHAHVTPSFDGAGKIVGYHSNRRVPDRAKVDKIAGIYQALLTEEGKYSDKIVAMNAGTALLTSVLAGQEIDYEEFVWSL
ncbi:MAG: PAS domain-containing protein [Candidatus Eisenbacteria bacterium]